MEKVRKVYGALKARANAAMAAAAVMVMAGAATASAEPTSFTLPTLPMGQFYTWGGTILGSLAVIWVFRKLVKTSNRS